MFWRRRHEEGTPNDGDPILAQVSAYLDGELTDAEAAEVERLIERDPVAGGLFDDLATMRTALGALGEVRAPRSFAIPAEAPAAARRGPLAMFHNVEMFMRASAAVAALLFVVALVNDPGGAASTVDTASQSEAISAGDAAGAATLQAPGSAEGGAAGGGEAAGTMLAPDEATTEAGGAPQPEGATDDGEDSQNFGSAADDPGIGQDSDTEGGNAEEQRDGQPSSATGAETLRSTEAVEPMPAGTELVDASSSGVGGMAPALAVLALMLGGMSALIAWDRRSGGSTT